MIDGPARPRAERKVAGAWYTPPDLADRMVARALDLVAGPARAALDPCCGAGAFLAAASSRGLAPCGVDASADALAACRAAVPGARLVAGDALLAPEHGGIDWAAAFPAAAGGFDLVAGNPPWEVLEQGAHAPHVGGARYAAKLRASGYRFQRAAAGGGGKINLYRVAVERAFGLLRPGGVLALLVPAGLLRDAGSAALRRHLLAAGDWEEVWELSSSAALFPSAHRDLPVAAVFIRRGGPTRAVRLAGGTLGRELLERFAPADLAIPAATRPGDLALLERLTGFPTLAACVRGIRKGDLNLATDRSWFRDAPTPLVLRTGRDIAPYRVARAATRWVDAAFDRAGQPWRHERVAWRDIADVTLRKRLCAAPLPPGSVLGDTLNYLRPPCDRLEADYWLAVLNSHAFEWTVRLRAAHNHLGQSVVGACPVPPWDPARPECQAAAAAGHAAAADPLLAHRADAAVARAYGMDGADMAHMLEAFPKQPAALRAAIAGALG